MRVLVTGASGFIGRAVVEALVREGHQVIAAARRPGEWDHPHVEPIEVDFSQVPATDWWRPRLVGVEAVVNAVGILREQGDQTFAALHAEAPIQLFDACAQAGVEKVIQISALGADEAAQSRYHLSKKRADDALRALPLDGAIVQPSLVYGAGGSSASLFNQLAALPVLALPHAGAMQVQPVHIDDVVAGVIGLLRARAVGVATIAFVGPRAMSLREYLRRLRVALGWGRRTWVLPLPVPVFNAGAALAGRLPGSFLDSETAAMLLRGNTAGAESFERLLRRAPRTVEDFVSARELPVLRNEAVLGVWLPVLRIALAALWIWTGIVSLGLYPVQDSLALLARVGLHGAVAHVALYGAALLDLALGFFTLAAPAHRRALLWGAQLALILAYTLLITVFLPEYWLHPYGPISKNLPLMAAIAMLWAFDAKGAPERTF